MQTLGSTLAEIEYEVTEFSQSLSDPGWNVYLCPIDQFYLFPGLKSMAKWQCPKKIKFHYLWVKISLTAVWQWPIGWLYVNSGLALARRDLAAAGA